MKRKPVKKHGGKRVGAGRPTLPKKRVHISAYVKEETKKEIDRKCFLMGVSRGTIIDDRCRPKTVKKILI